jgi:ABC-type Fe3+/spermidine/putrescine transport system ATPase subunit
MAPASERGRLELRGLCLSLGDFALQGVDLDCAPGEYHVLIGPTGCGKTSLVKCLLGLHRAEAGRLLLGNDDVGHAPPEARRMGYLPQNYALFPHMNVERNIRFGIEARSRGAAAGDIFERLVDLLRIRPLLQRSVGQLSGGERQKVALARALGAKPELILLDEPFSSLDEGSRRRLWLELRQVFAELGTTAIHITHSLEEASAMGDRISVMLDGRIVQTGQGREVLEHPASPAVAAFLGYRNLYPGRVRARSRGSELELGPLTLRCARRLPDGQAVQVCLRPQDLRIVDDERPLAPAIADNVFEGRLLQLMTLSDSCVALLQVGEGQGRLDMELRFPAHLRRRFDLEVGERIRVGLVEPGLIIYPG